MYVTGSRMAIDTLHYQTTCLEGRGGGPVVSVPAFYSDDPSSNPDEMNNQVSFVSLKFALKITKINGKEAEIGPFKIQIVLINFV